MWLRMEEAGVPANHVTFNILFYSAVKAGRFALADTIHNELLARNMELDRYFRISMIYYAGARGNGDGVRKAFNDMVNAGETIDVMVMNCVIRSLIHAGEAPAAEHVFEKMKEMHVTKFGTKGPNDWQNQRKLAKLLNETGKRLRKERELHESSFFGSVFANNDRREAIQRATPIAPTARTYRTLLRYHCRVSGDMDRIMELLAESRDAGFPMHGSVYLDLFVGFHTHGGYAFTAWKPSTLEAFWQDLLTEIDKPLTYHPPTPTSTDTDPDQPDANTPAEAEAEEEADSASFSGLEALEALETSSPLEEDDEFHEVWEEDKAPYFTCSMAVVATLAFHRCCGRRRMLAVWAEVQGRWRDMRVEDRQRVEDVLGEIERGGMPR
jgi:pentatricopeptide repeat protein